MFSFIYEVNSFIGSNWRGTLIDLIFFGLIAGVIYKAGDPIPIV